MLKKRVVRVGLVALIGLVAAQSAFAVDPTSIGELASAVDFGPLKLAMYVVGAALIGYYIVYKGIRGLIGMIR